MAVVERSTVGELVVRYRREPMLRDLFVEGNRDRAFLTWFLRSRGDEDTQVITIDHVEIPSALIVSHGFRAGRRGAIMTLARELVREAREVPVGVTCIADRDGEDVSGLEAPPLLFTDFSSLEMYFFESRFIAKVLVLAARRSDMDPEAIIRILQPPLIQLAAIRRANLSLELGLDWLSFDRCCTIRHASVEFEVDDFIRRYLSKGAKLRFLEEFLEEVRQQQSVIAVEPRLYISGHDFVAMLALYFDKSRILQGATEQHIESLLMTSSESAWLLEQPLFQQIISRTRGA